MQPAAISASSQIYLHANLELKERALSRVKSPNTKLGRYKPSDTLSLLLEAL